MSTRSLPTPAYLRQRLRYEPETGLLYWLEYPPRGRSWNSRLAGKQAFTHVGNHGYPASTLDGYTGLLAHRVILAMIHDAWPYPEVDHINRNRADNRLINLRVVTRSENRRNRTTPKKYKPR